MISSLMNWGGQYAKSSEDRARFYLSWIKKHSPVEGETALDIGCGSGFFSTAIKRVGGTVISLNINYRKNTQPDLMFITADATRMPIRGGVIKNMFSSDVYEHIKDQDLYLSENVRVMKEGGCGFFSTGNKFFPIDRHTGLPFIDLLPKRVASAWAAKKRGRPYSYTVYEPTFYGLHRRLLKVSKRYIIDHSMFIGFYKTVYPRLYCKGLKWFNAVRLLDRMGLLKLLTPKYYIVFRKDPRFPYICSWSKCD